MLYALPVFSSQPHAPLCDILQQEDKTLRLHVNRIQNDEASLRTVQSSCLPEHHFQRISDTPSARFPVEFPNKPNPTCVLWCGQNRQGL